MKYAHGIVDLETLGTGHNAPIIQVGISLPDENGYPGGEVLDIVIAYDESDYAPFEADTSTINWWLNEDRREPRNRMLSQPAWGWKRAMKAVNDFLSEYKKNYGVDVIYLWSHATFDPPILINAMKEAREEGKFRNLVHYRDMRDFRTTDWLFGESFKGYMYNEIEQNTKSLGLIHHYAPHDAIFEHHVLEYTMATLRDIFVAAGDDFPIDHLYLLQETENPPE